MTALWLVVLLAPAAAFADPGEGLGGESGAVKEAVRDQHKADDPAEEVGGSPHTKPKFEIHGFLTQAWASANFVGNRFPGPDGGDPGPTFDELALGIPEGGTFDYRTAALQFRYQISPRDIMIVQFSSRELGDSPTGKIEDEVELDWAFYERRLTDNTSLKVGRIQIPLGIFNEVRDVGTILPFYRPSFIFYREGTFTSETVDGLVFSHTFWSQSDWSLDLDLFAGDWETIELTPLGEGQATLAQDEGYGFQLWLNTPTPGLRIGFGGHHRDRTGGAEGIIRAPGATTRFDDWYASVDAVFDRFVARAEYRTFKADPEVSPSFLATDFTSKIELYYIQLGYHFSDSVRVYLQGEFNPNNLKASIFTHSFDVNLRNDYGLAFDYLFNPSLVFKAEYHVVTGEDFTLIPVFTSPTTFLLDPQVRDLDEGNYSIVSLSVSF